KDSSNDLDGGKHGKDRKTSAGRPIPGDHWRRSQTHLRGRAFEHPAFLQRHPTRFPVRRTPTSSTGTSRATVSKPLTVSRVFAVHTSETGSHDVRIPDAILVQ